MQKREKFSGQLGVIAAAVGSAVGLGNIWRFPFLCGQHGGGAFVLVYILCVVLIGLPILLSEFSIGRRGKSNAYRAFKVLAPGKPWYLIGVMGIIAALVIMSFYSAVGGWTIEYFIRSITNTMSDNPAEQFENFVAGGFLPIFYQLIFMLMCLGIVMLGVQKGIEKSNKILMPLLFLLLVILCVRAVMLPGAMEGIKFLFRPDFSQLTGNSILAAMGQAFFSLSIGMCCMITYGSYIKRKEDLAASSVIIAGTDTFVSLLGGILVFSVAAAFAVAPGAGPGLLFITLPEMFQQMTGGMIFSTLFFILLCIAALTSAISLIEVVVSFCVEEIRIGRTAATLLVSGVIFALGILCSLSLGLMPGIGLFGMNFFNFMDFTASNVLLPLGGFFISLFVGWGLKKRIVEKELTSDGTVKFTGLRVFFFLVRYVVPVSIFIVFISRLL